MPRVMVFFADRCTACRTCLAACRDHHGIPVGVDAPRMIEHEWIDRSGLGGIGTAVVPFGCAQCESPACLSECPVEAISFDDVSGLIRLDEEVCLGCGKCVRVCPFGAPILDVGRRKVFRCDGCRERLVMGMEPICSKACPNFALVLVERADLPDEAIRIDEVPLFGQADQIGIATRVEKAAPRYWVVPSPDLGRLVTGDRDGGGYGADGIVCR